MKMLEDLEEVVRNDHEKCPNFWAAIEFIRTHHATIRDMAARLEAAEKDAALILEVVAMWRTLERISGNSFERNTFKMCAYQIDAATQETGR